MREGCTFIILFSYFLVKSSLKILIKPASTIMSMPYSSSFSMIFVSNCAASAQSFLETTAYGISAFAARTRAYAEGLLEITRAISPLLMIPSFCASINA